MVSTADSTYFRRFTNEQRKSISNRLGDARYRLLAAMGLASDWKGDPLRYHTVLNRYVVKLVYEFKKAAEEAWEANVPLAYNQMRLRIRRGCPHFRTHSDDMLQVYFAAMWNSVLRFNPAKAQLSTFVVNGFLTVEKNIYSNLHAQKRTAGFQAFDEVVVEMVPCRLEHPEKEAELQDNRDYLNALMQCLPPRERLVVSRRMIGLKLSEIGKEIGVGSERVRQIYDRALEKLKRQGANPQPVFFPEEVLV
jgi:RNA polymerase sigma factor (sigma-70 family)